MKSGKQVEGASSSLIIEQPDCLIKPRKYLFVG